jgi:hypothetical protein
MVTARIAVLAVALAATFPAVAADDQQKEVLTWEQAGDHVGEQVTIEGRVLGVHCSPLSCLLAFEPTFNRFTAVVQASSFGEFAPDDLDGRYNGQRVRVKGTIVERDSKPEIIVSKKDDLVLLGETKKERKERQNAVAETQAEAQADTLERMADVLDRIEDLTERLAAVQERMDALLAAMEQREAALAAFQSNQQAPPPAPSYGEAQPRPAFEQLRTVKRGMTRGDVERLVGQPQYVEAAGNGWVTYYYGFGRSISFDARGRAQALVGFPPP